MKAYFKKKKEKRVSSFESNEVARLGRGDREMADQLLL